MKPPIVSFLLKRHVVAMRKVLSPQRDVFGLLAKRGDPRVSERTALHLRDVDDHLVWQRQGNKGEPWVKAAGGAARVTATKSALTSSNA